MGFAQQSKGSIIVNILITYTAPASTKLQVTEDVLVLHKCLTDDTPGSGNRREEGIFAALRETGRTVSTKRCRNIVTVIVIVHDTTQERDQRIVSGFTVGLIRTLLSGIHFLHLVQIIGNIITPCLSIVPCKTFGSKASHYIQVVLFSESVHVSGCIRPVPDKPLLIAAGDFVQVLFLQRIHIELRNE